MKFYIASSLENAAMVKRVAAVLVAAGHEHTYDWTTHGSVQCEGESRIREVAQNEIKGVANAQLVIVILPGGRGTHSELGIALGWNACEARQRSIFKRILICAADNAAFQQDERTCALYWPDGISRIVGEMDEWLVAILAEARCP